MVFLTSNSTRELSEALKRRCLYLYIDYPTTERERDILRSRVPGISEHLAGQLAAFVAGLRQLDLQQSPSVVQTLEWARTLLSLGAQDLDEGLAAQSLETVLVHRADIERAAAALNAGRLL
jgi:MoxR-like ATPase